MSVALAWYVPKNRHYHSYEKMEKFTNVLVWGYTKGFWNEKKGVVDFSVKIHKIQGNLTLSKWLLTAHYYSY